MIHYVTVHWNRHEWIAPQLQSLEEFSGQPYNVYAFLNGIDKRYDTNFTFVCREPIVAQSMSIEHAMKLNILADIACFNADSEDDLLCFLDGDAFLVAPLPPFAHEKLAGYPLVAVCRKENLGDVQPHPCFALTTVKFWKSLPGDWKQGYTWEVSFGGTPFHVTDTGGNLLGLLREKGIDWLPLLRSNIVDLHPLWFGVYGNIVYHHGAGFHPPASRKDLAIFRGRHPIAGLLAVTMRKSSVWKRLLEPVFVLTGGRRVFEKYVAEQSRLSDRVRAACLADIHLPLLFTQQGMTQEELLAHIASATRPLRAA